MQIKTKKMAKNNPKKLSKSKEQKLNELIEDVKQARKDFKNGKLFKGNAQEVIDRLKNSTTPSRCTSGHPS